LNQHDFGQLVSGRSTGFKSQMLRFFLRVVSQAYQFVIVLRNFLYSRGWLKIQHVNAMVISVGNITTGGTGKTPLVIWLYKFLQQKNIHCAILTRGYKTRRASCVMRRAKNERNTQYTTHNTIDEPAIIIKSCPRASVIINPDRVAGANEAVNRFGAKVLIMDDGFQHRRLARELDIVTIDATRPFGYGKLLPAGLLREPADSLKRADAVIITRCDKVSESGLNEIEKTLQIINPDMIIASSIHSPICAKTIDNTEISIEELKDKKVFAFCGIGNPDAFLNTIKGLGANPVGAEVYDDHYHYTNKDISDICREAMDLKADLILTTQKDFNRLPIEKRKLKTGIPFAYLAVELKIISGEERITQLIKDCLAGKIHILRR